MTGDCPTPLLVSALRAEPRLLVAASAAAEQAVTGLALRAREGHASPGALARQLHLESLIADLTPDPVAEPTTVEWEHLWAELSHPDRERWLDSLLRVGGREQDGTIARDAAWARDVLRELSDEELERADAATLGDHDPWGSAERAFGELLSSDWVAHPLETAALEALDELPSAPSLPAALSLHVRSDLQLRRFQLRSALEDIAARDAESAQGLDAEIGETAWRVVWWRLDPGERAGVMDALFSRNARLARSRAREWTRDELFAADVGEYLPGLPAAA